MQSTALLSMTGQSIWLDNITRSMLDSGTLERYIRDLSVVGLTSNPTIFEKAVKGGAEYDAQIRDLRAKGLTAEQTFFEIAIADLTRATDLFARVHARTGGVDGWVSLEVSPLLANDTVTTVAEAKSLWHKAGRKNLFIKVPGTKEGIPAIEELIASGVPINVTLLFSCEQYLAAAEAYLRGLERRVKVGQAPDVTSVASVFVSRWDRKASPLLPANLKETVGIAVARRCYNAYCNLYASDRWLTLEAAGARPQRLLYASTGTKDPKLSPSMYIEALASARTVNTIPEETLLAFAQQGKVGAVLSPTDASCESQLAEVTKAGVNLGRCADELQLEGRDSFNKSWNDLIATIEAKSVALVR
ncbi:MAG: transaldolase [Phycisphaerales bacterium]|nr:transaldolase [Phycisphaerales bacterium]